MMIRRDYLGGTEIIDLASESEVNELILFSFGDKECFDDFIDRILNDSIVWWNDGDPECIERWTIETVEDSPIIFGWVDVHCEDLLL